MMSNSTSKKRKVASGITACALAVTMLVGGTLTYFYQSMTTNPFEGTKKEVVGHDDFIEGVNKDVYVENTGEVPVYVRVKLTEDFTLNGEPIVAHTADVTHIPTQDPDEANDVTLGTRSKDGNKVGDIHSYFTWEMGNETDVKTYLSAKDENAYTADKTDGIYMEDGVAKNNTTGTPTGEHAKDTPTCKVIAMADYNKFSDAEKRLFVGWVIDSDGWAYWSQMLQPDAATGLLLNNVVVSPALANEDYTYNIHVFFEAVDETDKGLWTANKVGDSAGNATAKAEQASEDAQKLMGHAQAMNDSVDTEAIARVKEKINNVQTQLEDSTTTDAEKATLEKAKGFYEQALDSFVMDDNNSGKAYETAGDETLKGKDVGIKDDAADGKKYVNNKDGTYTSGSGLILDPGEDGNIGTGDDTVIGTTGPIDPSLNSTWFRIHPDLTNLYFNGTTGESRAIVLEDRNGNPLNNSDYTFYVAKNGFINAAGNSIAYVSVNDAGVVTVVADTPSNTIVKVYAESKADGSLAESSVQVQAASVLQSESLQPSKVIDTTFNASADSLYQLPFVEVQSVTGSNILITDSFNYEIQGENLGCHVTTSGILTTGTTAGDVKVKVTGKATNTYSAPITYTPDSATPGVTATAEPGEAYSLVGYITVSIGQGVDADHGADCPYDAAYFSGKKWDDIAAASSYTAGNGTQNTPYEISCICQLKKLSDDISKNGVITATYGKYFKLTADLDFTDVKIDRNLIGSEFSGTFDGARKQIKNAEIANGTIFGTINNGAVVKNLARVGGSSTGTYIGGIAVSATGGSTIDNCYNTASVTAPEEAGGIVRTYQNGAKISNCLNTGTITGLNTAAGIACYDYGNGSTLENCVNTGKIASNKYIGGILGLVHGGSRNSTIRNCINYGEIQGKDSAISGSVIGEIMLSNHASGSTVTLTGSNSVPGALYINDTQTPGQMFGTVAADSDIFEVVGMSTVETADPSAAPTAGFLVSIN